MSAVTVETGADGIARIAVNRPDKRNAVDPAARAALIEAFSATLGDAAVAAVEDAIADAAPLSRGINAWETHWPLNTYAHDMDASKLSQGMRDRLAQAESMTQDDYQKLLDARGLVRAAYRALVEARWARRAEVPGAVAAMAAAARAAGVTILGHDETSPLMRAEFRALGAVTCEFTMTLETAEAARAAGEHVVLGAPNVVRGASHNNALDAAAAVAGGLCTVLASDYYYPAPLLAAFRLAERGIVPLAAAWALVSRNAAEAAGLTDRGEIVPGRRADLILVDTCGPLPRVVAAIVGGKRVYGA